MNKKNLLILLTVLNSLLFVLLVKDNYRNQILNCNRAKLECRNTYFNNDHSALTTKAKVTDKYYKDNIYYIRTDTLSSKGEFVSALYRLPPEQVITVANIEAKSGSTSAKEMTPKELYNLISPNEQIKVQIIYPSRSEIISAKKIIKDEYYVNCFYKNRSFIEYISNNNKIFEFIYNFINQSNSCPINLTTVIIKE